mmetsp:Transcript_57036/g.107254  ORF Transcript_57036/g.107254 Transcript_57036/m.107254 type:complete len:270 (-) Transcript_57036:970-1779(-)
MPVSDASEPDAAKTSSTSGDVDAAESSSASDATESSDDSDAADSSDDSDAVATSSDSDATDSSNDSDGVETWSDSDAADSSDDSDPSSDSDAADSSDNSDPVETSSVSDATNSSDDFDVAETSSASDAADSSGDVNAAEASSVSDTARLSSGAEPKVSSPDTSPLSAVSPAVVADPTSPERDGGTFSPRALSSFSRESSESPPFRSSFCCTSLCWPFPECADARRASLFWCAFARALCNSTSAPVSSSSPTFESSRKVASPSSLVFSSC